MNDVAVVKPDHIGDFMLSVPALTAIEREVGPFDLFASPVNQFLQQRFLPNATFRPIRLKHLQKDGTGEEASELGARLRRYGFTFFLRDDHVLRSVYEPIAAYAAIGDTDDDTHETLLQERALQKVFPGYRRGDRYATVRRTGWPTKLRRVGLCISAGFVSNRFPTLFWVELARAVEARFGAEVVFIGGPLEAKDLETLSRLTGAKHPPIVGGRDLDAFFGALERCDVVVGTDSGSLHLISSCLPVLGLFASSPWRRYSPFGVDNRVLRVVLGCAPCFQFSHFAYNGCLTRECATTISAEHVCNALTAQPSQQIVAIGDSVELVFGPSHLPPPRIELPVAEEQHVHG